jgi:hypothetical protein
MLNGALGDKSGETRAHEQVGLCAWHHVSTKGDQERSRTIITASHGPTHIDGRTLNTSGAQLEATECMTGGAKGRGDVHYRRDKPREHHQERGPAMSRSNGEAGFRANDPSCHLMLVRPAHVLVVVNTIYSYAFSLI